jgi:hypothetical protein
MTKDWKEVIAAKQNEWNIPAAAVSAFDGLVQAADSALTAALNETTRTAVANALCKAAFGALVEGMRDTKRRYFLEPPLTDADLVSLSLKPHSGSHTASGAPSAQVGQKTCGFLSRSLHEAQTPHNYPLNIIGWSFAEQNSRAIRLRRIARHELGFRVVYVTGNANDPADKGFRVYYRVVAPPGMAAVQQPPASPEDLTTSFFTHRKKDVIKFGFNDSGSTVFFAVQVENEGKKGPWGPMTSALIP